MYKAVEKAILYLDNDELPPHWDRELLFGIDKNYITSDSEMAYNTDVFVFKNFIIINVFYYLFILIFVYYLK